ncbi:MAG: hypothetical protein AAF491_05180, partial [Verrucomicrobiota bacterium]
DLGDEDAISSEETDRLDEFPGNEFRLGLDDENPESGNTFQSSEAWFRIVVESERCTLETPRWLAGTPPRDNGAHPLEEPFQRLETLQRLASWLTERRRAFLNEPDPWNLGVDALEELEKGHPSVTEVGLMRLLGFKAEINRHKRYCEFVWPDGTLPLEFLFRPEAKQAWVASALVQRYRDKPLTEETLAKVDSLTMPKSQKEKRSRLSQKIDSLSFPQFIQRLCIEVGVSWSNVLSTYRDRILLEFQQI